MARKQATPAPSPVPPKVSDPLASRSSAASAPRSQTSTPAKKTSGNTNTSGSIRSAQDVQAIVRAIWNKYLEETPQRTKLLDVFLGFLIAVGAIQFLYCVVAGNFVRRLLSCIATWGSTWTRDIHADRSITFSHSMLSYLVSELLSASSS